MAEQVLPWRGRVPCPWKKTYMDEKDEKKYGILGSLRYIYSTYIYKLHIFKSI
jgi:hypothetical protein